ncbi:MAG: hypothetical protein JNL28_08560 [Planctomycetes bacterium]|nr:hypothetical protein [Planctomycetota bacterium]
MKPFLWSTLALATFAGGASAQTITTLVLEGDSVGGVGLVTGLESIAITDSGTWLIEVDTDNADTTIDGVMFSSAGIVQLEGTAVSAPAGALHNEFTSRSLRNNNDAAHIWSLTNTPGGTADNVALYVNTTLVLSKGSTPLATAWGAGTIHNGLSWATLNDSNQILLRGFATDPISTPTNDWFASILQLDGTFAATSEILLARAGEVLPGQSFGVNTVGSGQDLGFINTSGQAIFRVSLSGAPTTADAAVYFWDGTNNILVANEGSPSPVVGRLWGSLTAPELAINDAGDYVVKDTLNAPTASDEIIAKNGVKLVQEGDPVPGLPAFAFTTFGNTPVSLTAAGQVLWYGDWNDTNTTIDTGIFLDSTMLIQEGVTPHAGTTFNALGNVGSSATAGQNGSMYISSNGRYVIFTGRLGAPINKRGIFLLDRTNGITPTCFGDGTGTACPCANTGAAGHGCGSSVVANGGLLTGSGLPKVGSDSLLLTATDVPNGPGLYFQGAAPIVGGLSFGDGLLCVTGSIIRLGVVFAAANTSQYPNLGDPGIAVSGFNNPSDVREYQLWYRDADLGFCTPANFNLTNAVSVIWQ